MKIDTDILWGNGINLSGLQFNKPVKFTLSNYGEWWTDRSGNYIIYSIGLEEKSGIITFSSFNKEDVDNWTKGVKSTMTMLKQWAK